jgi:hypothetical protein
VPGRDHVPVDGDGAPEDPLNEGDPAGCRRERAERELRVATIVALALLLVGQILLLAGLGTIAVVVLAVPGTIAGVVLARRWQRMAAGD